MKGNDRLGRGSPPGPIAPAAQPQGSHLTESQGDGREGRVSGAGRTDVCECVLSGPVPGQEIDDGADGGASDAVNEASDSVDDAGGPALLLHLPEPRALLLLVLRHLHLLEPRALGVHSYGPNILKLVTPVRL